MIKVKFKSNDFLKEMNSIVDYATGFLDGAKAGKAELLETVGLRTKEILEQFIMLMPEPTRQCSDTFMSGSSLEMLAQDYST